MRSTRGPRLFFVSLLLLPGFAAAQPPLRSDLAGAIESAKQRRADTPGASSDTVQKVDEIRVYDRVEPEDKIRQAKPPIAKLRDKLDKSAKTRGTVVTERTGSDGARVAKVETAGRTYWITEKRGQVDFAGMGKGGVAMSCMGGCP